MELSYLLLKQHALNDITSLSGLVGVGYANGGNDGDGLGVGGMNGDAR